MDFNQGCCVALISCVVYFVMRALEILFDRNIDYENSADDDEMDDANEPVQEEESDDRTPDELPKLPRVFRLHSGGKRGGIVFSVEEIEVHKSGSEVFIRGEEVKSCSYNEAKKAPYFPVKFKLDGYKGCDGAVLVANHIDVYDAGEKNAFIYVDITHPETESDETKKE
ncbi:MAG: hypothetical protein HUK22_06945 [Thermoguttaceae bacterium]|nr:hypothetical protein [Thermoguttaceae bacterium]